MIELTVYFEGPFWVAVLERRDGDEVRAARLVLGTEPTDTELYELLRHAGNALLRQSANAPWAPTAARTTRHANPKRLAREAARRAAEHRPSTAAQEALSRQYDQRRDASRDERRNTHEADAERRRQLRRTKSRERHRGH